MGYYYQLFKQTYCNARTTNPPPSSFKKKKQSKINSFVYTDELFDSVDSDFEDELRSELSRPLVEDVSSLQEGEILNFVIHKNKTQLNVHLKAFNISRLDRGLLPYLLDDVFEAVNAYKNENPDFGDKSLELRQAELKKIKRVAKKTKVKQSHKRVERDRKSIRKDQRKQKEESKEIDWSQVFKIGEKPQTPKKVHPGKLKRKKALAAKAAQKKAGQDLRKAHRRKKEAKKARKKAKQAERKEAAANPIKTESGFYHTSEYEDYDVRMKDFEEDIKSESGLFSKYPEYKKLQDGFNVLEDNPVSCKLMLSFFMNLRMLYYYPKEWATHLSNFLLANFEPEHFDFIYDKLSVCFKQLSNILPGSGIFTEAGIEPKEDRVESFLTFLESLSDNIANINIVSNIKRIILSVVSFKFFSKENAFLIQNVLGRVQPMSYIELFSTLFKDIIQLIRVGWKCIRDKDVGHLFGTFENLVTLELAASTFLANENNTYSGLPVEGQICEKEYLMNGMNLIPDIKQALKTLSPYDGRFNSLMVLHAKIVKVVAYYRNKVSAGRRGMPAGIILSGAPGIGKSNILDWIHACYSRAKGRIFHDSHVYCRTKGSDFFDGHNPLSEYIITYSEMANTSVAFAKTQRDTYMEEMNSIIDSRKFSLNMARLEDKGRCFAMPELVTLDTNNPGLHLEHTVSNPAALRRRFLTVELTVKECYRKEGSCELDFDKANASDGFWLDLYNFNLYSYESINASQSKPKNLLQTNNFKHFSDFLCRYFRNHISRNEAMAQKISEGMNVNKYYDSFNINHVLDNSPIEIPDETEFEEADVFICDEDCKEDFIELYEGNIETEAAIDVLPERFTVWSKKLAKACSEYIETRFVLKVHKVLHKKSRSHEFWDFSFWNVFFMLWFIAFVYKCPKLFCFILCLTLTVLSQVNIKGYIVRKLTSDQSKYEHELIVWTNYIKYLCGLGDVPIPKDSYSPNIDIALKGMTLLLTIIGAYKLARFSTTKKVSAQSTVFKFDTDENDELNDYEKMFQSGGSVTRIATRSHNSWNTMVQKYKRKPHTGSLSDFSLCINKNVRRVDVINSCFPEGRAGKTYVLGVCEDLALINTHSLGTLDTLTQIRVHINVESNGRAITNISKYNLVHLGNDVSMIRLERTQFSNILKHINTIEVHNENFYKAKIANVETTALIQSFTAADSYVGSVPIKNGYCYDYAAHTPGDCGLPLTANVSNGNALIGFHAAGGGKQGFATPISLSIVEKGIQKIRNITPFCAIQSEKDIGELELPCKKSLVRFEDTTSLLYHGKVPGPVLAKGKSKVTPTPFKKEVLVAFEEILEFKQEKFFGKPMMGPKVVNGEYCNPYNNFVNKLNVDKRDLDDDIMIVVMDKITERILSQLEELNITELNPLDIEVAINGANYDAFLRRMNASTSSGFGLSGVKGDHLPIYDDSESPEVYRELTQECKKILLDYFRDGLNGEALNFINSTALKDEPRTLEKCIAGKTRVFNISQLMAVVISRMFLSPFYTLMVQHNDVFRTTVGINMHSEGASFINEFRDHSEDIMEGDYGGYDTTMPFKVTRAANTIIERVLKALGYNELALSMVRAILSENLFVILEILKDIFTILGYQPSGKYATAEDNSLKGLILVAYWFYSIYDSSEDFFEVCKLRTYGDDMLNGVKKGYGDVLNNVTYQKFCEEVYGMEFTTAEKGQVMEKFKTWRTCSYLKRTFVEHDELGTIVAKLDMNSLLKTLQWYIPSRTVTVSKQLQDTFNAVVWELVFHCSSDTHHKIRERLVTILSSYLKVDYSIISKNICTFEEVKERLFPATENAVEYDLRQPASDALYTSTLNLFVMFIEDTDPSTECWLLLARQVSEDLQRDYHDFVRDVLRLRTARTRISTERGFTEGQKYALLEKEIVGEYTQSFYTSEKVSKHSIFVTVGSKEVSTTLANLKFKNKPLFRNLAGFESCLLSYYRFAEIKQDESLFSEPISSLLVDRLNFYTTQLTQVEKEIKLMNTMFVKDIYQLKKRPLVTSSPSMHSKSEYIVRVLSREADLKLTIDLIKKSILKSSESKIITESGTFEMDDGEVDSKLIDVHDNLTDVTGAPTNYESSGVSHMLDQGAKNILTMDNVFNRPIELTTFQTPVGGSISVKLKVWDLASLNAFFRSKTRNFAYFKGKLMIKVVVSGSPFHYGRLMLSYQPYPLRNATLVAHEASIAANTAWRPMLLNYLSQSRESVAMSVTDNEPTILEIPMITPKAMFRLYNTASTAIADTTSFDDFENAGTLFLYSIGDIKAAAATASNVSVQVYGWFEDVELGCPTGTNIQITTESGLSEMKTGPVEKITSSLAQMAGALKKVPFIAPYAKASEFIFKGLRDISSIFGWSKPVLVDTPAIVKNEPFQNGSQVIGCDTVKRITLDPMQEITVSPSAVASEHDEMTIAYIASKECYLDSFNWNDDSAVMTNIFKCRVHPMLATMISGIENYFQPTPMCFAATPFEVWRGTISFRFDIVCSAYHRGKLAFYYEPNLAQQALIDADLDMNKNFFKIIDIQETQSITFCVKWASDRTWLRCFHSWAAGLNYQDFSATNQALGYANGYIGVVPFTTLQSPDNSDIDVNVYVYSDDLQVNHLNDSNITTRRLISTESGLTPVDTRISSTKAVTCMDLNPSSATDIHVSLLHYGEEPLSFRPLLNRYTTNGVVAVSLDATTLKKIDTTYPAMPVNSLVYGEVTTVANSYRELYSYLKYAYVGVRGGIRWRIRPNFRIEETACQRFQVELIAPGTSMTTAVSINTNIPKMMLNGSVSCVPSTNGGLEVEIPFYSNNQFVFAFADDLIGTNNDGEMETTWLKEFKTSFEAHNATEAGDVIYDYATGEDFTFLRFQGAPYYSGTPLV